MLNDNQLHRPPRIQPILPTDTVEVPGPPENKQQQGRQLIAALLPSVTLVGFLLASVLGQSGNLILMLPMGLSMIVSTSFSVYLLLLDRRETAKQTAEYRARLLELRRRMEQYAVTQREFYFHNFPDPDTVLRIASGELSSAHGSRLWERLPSDEDFAEIRLGIGSRESSVHFTAAFKDNLGDPLVQEGQKLVEDARYVHSVPYTITLRPSQKRKDNEVEQAAIVGTHALGIYGANKTLVDGFVRQLIVQYTTFHSPNDSSLYFFNAARTRARAEENEKQWRWIKKLPHANSERDILGDRVCFDALNTSKTTSSIQVITTRLFWNYLQAELEERTQRLKDREAARANNPTFPHILVMVNLVNSDLSVEDVMQQAPVRTILRSGEQLGASIIFVALSSDQVPAECSGLVELISDSEGGGSLVRYAQTGTNAPRFKGTAEVLPVIETESASGSKMDFADILYKVKIPATSSDLRRSVMFLELFNLPDKQMRYVADLKILDEWKRSLDQPEWMRVPVGIMINGDPRMLEISSDGDGAHGIVAGTTGSGKSELLRTFIAGLAVRYDPQILNFVLVDYKGGAAFTPFQKLPHCVDIVTNLHGRAVERMFDAIQAELEQRQKKLADNNVDHIVAYRKKNYHRISKDQDDKKGPFPHLFIIVDEFAEMIKENPDFKVKFESIARLGRALGVTLILATQRPTGYVSDQMRANMKFRVCLRVETQDDSRELLGRSDAAFLPTNIIGRAYVQAGNDSPTLVQVAYTASKHNEDKDFADEDIRWIDDSGESTEHNSDTTMPTLLDWVVEETRRLVKEQNIPIQRKPWPDPLPNPMPHQELDDTGKTVIRRSPLPLNLPLDTTYFPAELRSVSGYMLAPALAAWLEIAHTPPEQLTNVWQTSIWLNPTERLTANIGVIDNPTKGEQRPLQIDLSEGPIAFFGAPGWGKSTFLRTLIITLAVTHSPDDLHIYCLDLGSQGLSVLKDLPHIGDIIELSERSFDDRIARLINMVDYELEARQDKVKEFGSIVKYNEKHPDKPVPAILLVIDGVIEIKENDELIAKLGRMIRGGLAYGVYFVFTGTQSGDIPKIYNLFTQRMSLWQADSSEYMNIVGRNAPLFDSVTGRGVIAVERTPLVFQLGIPVDAEWSDLIAYQNLAQIMKDYRTGKPQPDAVELLPTQISLGKISTDFKITVEAQSKRFSEFIFPIGQRDKDRKPAILMLKDQPHLLVIGPRFSGKTLLLRVIAQSLALTFTSAEVGIVLVDLSGNGKLVAKDAKWIGELPQVIDVITRPEQLEGFVERLELEYNDQCGKQNEAIPPTRHIVVIIDNYLLVPSSSDKLAGRLGALAEQYTDRGLHFILAGTRDLVSQRTSDTLVRQVNDISYGMALQTTQAVESLDGQLPFGTVVDHPQGRGWIVRLAHPELMQAALPLDQVEFSELQGEEKSPRLGWRCVKAKTEDSGDRSNQKPVNRSLPPPPLPPGMKSPAPITEA